MFRDSETGRSKINTPAESDDIANKGYVDSRETFILERMSAKDDELSNAFASRIEMAEQTLNGNIEDTKRELSANIDEVESIAKGATQAESFFDYEEMVEKLNVAPRDTYRIGQSLFINTRNVPDLWIYNKGISSTTYNYSTDEVFVNELKSKGYVKVGYFTLSALETQKVDLTDYPTTEEVASIVKSVTYDKKEIDNKVESIKPDNIYANVLKGTESGAVVSMDDVSPIPHKVKAKTRGKNLLSVDANPSESTTATALDNNSLILGTTGLVYSPQCDFWRGVLPAGDYILSLNVSTENDITDGRPNEVFIWINDELLDLTVLENNVPTYVTKKFTVPDNNKANIIRFTYYINVRDYITYNNYKATLTNIQLEKGSVATDFTPYVPNDTQITVTSLGKNLLCVNPNGLCSESVTRTVLDNNSFAVEATGIQHSPQYSFWEGKLSAGQYSLSFDIDIENNVINSGSNKVYFWFNNTFETLRQIGENVPTTFKATFTVPNDNTLVRLTYYINVDINVEYNNYKATLTNIQLEKGTVATEYEPYIEGETVTTTIAEGAELNSVAPNMTIATDTQGVIIDAEYNKDTNKVIEKLTQAIISLGGNI
jgi:hypothetical protein